uniref:NAD(P)-binding domain-containing protein n=1 Tax=Tetradesmus obliquus TaxID=3088 RepID=A0A383W2H3_TETOB|eukprot:jgi/Sobl393_1/1171/SZX71339.1
MLDAMAAAGVKRLVAVTSQGVLSDPAEPYVYRFIKPFLMADMCEDMRRLEQLIVEAGTAGALSWTLLRPTKLEDAPIGNRKPQVGEGLLFRGSSCKVDRADLADLIVAAVQDEAQYKGKTLYIST